MGHDPYDPYRLTEPGETGPAWDPYAGEPTSPAAQSDPAASGWKKIVSALQSRRTVAVSLAVALAFTGGGLAAWALLRGGEPTAAPLPEQATVAPVPPSPSATPSAKPEPSPSQPTEGAGQGLAAEETPSPEQPPPYLVSAATGLAASKGLTCTDEWHREISSIWCVDDSAQVRMYIGGDSEGQLKHLSFTTVGNTDGDLLGDLWRAGGALMMPADDFDEAGIAREFKGMSEGAELPMGGRLVRVTPWTSVIITTPGWAAGLEQPSFFPFSEENYETLGGYGFTCSADTAGDSFNCMGVGDDGGSFTAGGSNDGLAWALGGPDEFGPPGNASLQLQSLAWALTGRGDALYDPIFALEVGQTALVDGLWMSHISYLAGDSEVQEFNVEVGCWAAARTDC